MTQKHEELFRAFRNSGMRDATCPECGREFLTRRELPALCPPCAIKALEEVLDLPELERRTVPRTPAGVAKRATTQKVTPIVTRRRRRESNPP